MVKISHLFLQCLGHGQICAMAKYRTVSALEVSELLHSIPNMFYPVHKRLRNTAQPSVDFYYIVHMCSNINCHVRHWIKGSSCLHSEGECCIDGT